LHHAITGNHTLGSRDVQEARGTVVDTSVLSDVREESSSTDALVSVFIQGLVIDVGAGLGHTLVSDQVQDLTARAFSDTAVSVEVQDSIIVTLALSVHVSIGGIFGAFDNTLISSNVQDSFNKNVITYVFSVFSLSLDHVTIFNTGITVEERVGVTNTAEEVVDDSSDLVDCRAALHALGSVKGDQVVRRALSLAGIGGSDESFGQDGSVTVTESVIIIVVFIGGALSVTAGSSKVDQTSSHYVRANTVGVSVRGSIVLGSSSTAGFVGNTGILSQVQVGTISTFC